MPASPPVPRGMAACWSLKATGSRSTSDGFAVLRDPIACKHAVLAETDDWVAMATEFRAIAPLRGSDKAVIWEPNPQTIYTWGGDAEELH